MGVVIVVLDALLQENTKNLSLPPLEVGIGIYLPPSLQTLLVVGAVLGYLLELRMRAQGQKAIEAYQCRGTLFSSGLIVGESSVGVMIAAVVAVSFGGGSKDKPMVKRLR